MLWLKTLKILRYASLSGAFRSTSLLTSSTTRGNQFPWNTWLLSLLPTSWMLSSWRWRLTTCATFMSASVATTVCLGSISMICTPSKTMSRRERTTLLKMMNKWSSSRVRFTTRSTPLMAKKTLSKLQKINWKTFTLKEWLCFSSLSMKSYSNTKKSKTSYLITKEDLKSFHRKKTL